MRYTIYEGEKDVTPIKNEITYLEEYIAIQKIRYQKNVDIKFIKDVEDDTILVSPLLFIMLIENAFKHGVESLAADAFVKIRLLQEQHTVTFEVVNNFESKTKSPHGLGLKNLKKRLEHLYPKRHSLDLTAGENVYNARITLSL